MTKKQDIKNVGVVGAGTMGAAIAQHFAMKGVRVTLVDINTASLEKGVNSIKQSLDEGLKRKLFDDKQKQDIENKIHGSVKFEDLATCEFVIEAVFEDFNVKSALFKRLETIVPTDTIIASNTSSFAVTDLAKGLNHPERFLGVHYFYHAAKNKLVEIIPGAKTAPHYVESLNNFYEFHDKVPVIVKDVAGFAINRFFVPWLNEAARLFEEKLGSPAFIDEVAMKKFKIGMGPFALMNATGVPIAYHAASNLAATFGPFYAPAAILKKQTDLREPWKIDQPYSGDCNETVVAERLLGCALGIAAQMVSEWVTDSTSTDLATRVGLRWAKGPFEMMSTLGYPTCEKMIQNLFQKWDMPLPTIFTAPDRKKLLTPELIRSSKHGKTAYIEFNRPDSMNALNEELMQQLDESVTAMNQDRNIEKIIFMGRGKAFVAGADIKFFLKNIDAGTIDKIYKFTEFGQNILKKIANSPKTTIAYLDGLTLGGGLELALSCHYRIGTERLMAAFPETGIGIFPGLGGTQRAPRLMGKGLAKFLIATGKMINAKTALSYHLIDKLIDRVVNPHDLENITFDKTRETINTGKFLEQDFANFKGLLSPEIFDQEPFKTYEKQLKSKSPSALKVAMNLVDEGENKNLDDALALELKQLNATFAFADAKTGLSSVMTREKPIFKSL